MERVRQAFPAETVSQIENILANAQAAGVPSGPLMDKALEGAAKGVPGNRVVIAISAYAERLQETRTLVGADRGVASVVAGADALRRGVPQQLMGTLASRHQGDIAVPLVVLGDLIEAGVPADQAYGIVDDALAQDHLPEEILVIPGAVERLMRQGQSARRKRRIWWAGQLAMASSAGSWDHTAERCRDRHKARQSRRDRGRQVRKERAKAIRPAAALRNRLDLADEVQPARGDSSGKRNPPALAGASRGP